MVGSWGRGPVGEGALTIEAEPRMSKEEKGKERPAVLPGCLLAQSGGCEGELIGGAAGAARDAAQLLARGHVVGARAAAAATVGAELAALAGGEAQAVDARAAAVVDPHHVFALAQGDVGVEAVAAALNRCPGVVGIAELRAVDGLAEVEPPAGEVLPATGVDVAPRASAATADGDAVLDAAWRVYSLPDRRMVTSKSWSGTEPLATDGFDAVALSLKARTEELYAASR